MIYSQSTHWHFHSIDAARREYVSMAISICKVLFVMIDWSLPAVVVKSRRNVYATTTAPLRISSRRSAPNYLRWADRQQRHVFCFFTRVPFISARTIRSGFDTSISVECSARSALFFTLLDTLPPSIARWNKISTKAPLDFSRRKIPRRKNVTDTPLPWRSASDVIALFVSHPSARWPGIIGYKLWYIWHDGWPRHVRRSNPNT